MSNKIIWNYCSSCCQDTKHTVLFQKEVTEKDSENEFELSKLTFQIVECNGCESVSFRREFLDYLQLEIEEEYATENPEIKLYPSPLQNHKLLSYTYSLPKKIRLVYEQTILALKGESKLLAAIGFRAVIEAICIEEKIKGQNLEQKINNLVKSRLITDKEGERLHSIRFLGNDSVHEIEMPNDDKLFLVLNIIEQLLRNLYIIDAQARYKLDTIIKTYQEFESLLWLCVQRFQLNEAKSLKEILGKHIRRITSNLEDLEKQLVDRIQKSEITFLALQNESQEIYTYIILENVEEMPF